MSRDYRLLVFFRALLDHDVLQALQHAPRTKQRARRFACALAVELLFLEQALEARAPQIDVFEHRDACSLLVQEGLLFTLLRVEGVQDAQDVHELRRVALAGPVHVSVNQLY